VVLVYSQPVLSQLLGAGEVLAVLVLSSMPLNFFPLHSCLWLLSLVLLCKDWRGTGFGGVAPALAV